MTKRLTLVLVTVALVILIAVIPVLAEPARCENGMIIIPGIVTVAAVGGQDFYLGDAIEFAGRNTATDLTYLFITGPNMAEQGSRIHNRDPEQWVVENDNAATFKQVGVSTDHTWSWKWDTANYALDEGKYTIYAVGQPYDKNHLECSPYGTTIITIKKPLVSTVSTTAIARTTPEAPGTNPARSPGYGFLIALTSLGAVVFIAVRRH